MMMCMVLMAMCLVQPDAPDAGGAPIPDWYLEHVEYMTAEGGVWHTDNTAYQSESEPFDTYVVDFDARFGGTGLTGELYGFEGETRSPVFWDFSGYWDPGAGTAMLVQHGWGGGLGAGTLMQSAPDTYLAAQDFHVPGQAPRHEVHTFRVIDAVTHETVTTHVAADGSRTPGRTYVWRRQP
jgi:hypothetical protein